MCFHLFSRFAGDQTYFDEIKQFYYRDEFSHQVQEWNRQRTLAIERALNQFLYPQMAKELKSKLIAEAKESIVKVTCQKISKISFSKSLNFYITCMIFMLLNIWFVFKSPAAAGCTTGWRWLLIGPTSRWRKTTTWWMRARGKASVCWVWPMLLAGLYPPTY